MKKWLPLIIIAILAIALYTKGKSFNNSVVKLEQTVKKSWGNVQTSYQRRNDLIGNLVNTVKGAADFEKSTLEAVIKARSEATKTTIDPSNITPEQLEKFNKAQSGLNSALSRLLVTIEKYPDLKTSQNFLKLQDELVSTENTIQTARVRFNEAIEPYNVYIKSFPEMIFASILNYDEKPFFDSVTGADKPVDVDFSN